MIKYSDMDHHAFVGGLDIKSSQKVKDCCYACASKAVGSDGVKCSKCGNIMNVKKFEE